MSILVIGLNHKTASVEIRERLAFNAEKLESGLEAIRSLSCVNEAALLSTCNRVEIYASVTAADEAENTIKDLLASFHATERQRFEQALYVHADEHAVRHIFRVGASLDSMVVGEPQILGQLKDTFDYALANKSTGIIMNRLMKKAISTAKRVRTETRIAENAVSISFAAVELAKKIFTDLTTKAVMLLGAGEMAELAARHLVSNGVTNIRIANRTYERCCQLAEEFCGTPVRFDDFLKELVQSDILICSTGASTYVLLKDQMQRIMKERRHKPVFIIDISVPRNIDPAINDLDSVYLYHVDDLQQVVDTNILERKKEAEKAEAIIDEEVVKFMHWTASLDSVPIIVALRQKAEQIKQDELERFRNKNPHLDPATAESIEYLVSAVVNKLIHQPTVALKDLHEDRELLTMAVKKLYGLDEDDEE
ncbi:MAG TPA: glutamyl-tRNA reductase [Dissulfurispiraceae bacterium]|nr:glutamyl-tRNA reductase [Dissulfurispiraceae bacterium]